jgi:hypothetical protein
VVKTTWDTVFPLSLRPTRESSAAELRAVVGALGQRGTPEESGPVEQLRDELTCDARSTEALTQSWLKSSATVTEQIRPLQEDIGSQLLNRVGRTVKLAVAGARIMDARPARGRVRHRSVRRSAWLGATSTAVMGLRPPPLRRWMHAHPDIQIPIESDTAR